MNEVGAQRGHSMAISTGSLPLPQPDSRILIVEEFNPGSLNDGDYLAESFGSCPTGPSKLSMRRRVPRATRDLRDSSACDRSSRARAARRCEPVRVINFRTLTRPCQYAHYECDMRKKLIGVLVDFLLDCLSLLVPRVTPPALEFPH